MLNLRPVTFSAYYSGDKKVDELLRENAEDQTKPWLTHGRDNITYAAVGKTKHVWTKGDKPSEEELEELGNPNIHKDFPYYYRW